MGFMKITNDDESFEAINHWSSNSDSHWSSNSDSHWSSNSDSHWSSHKFVDTDSDVDVMSVVGSVVGVVVVLAVLAVFIKCCCCHNRNGRVLQPAPPLAGAPYPRQQYTATTVPVMATVHNTSYPGAAPATAHYPGAAHYPAPAATHYPVVSPYPGPGPYPGSGAMLQPSHAPSAPDAHALPPSYDQAMGGAAADTMPKQAPYNPYAPH